MINKIELPDNFRINGVKTDDFLELLENIVDITGDQVVRTSNLEILTVDTEHSDYKIIEAIRYLGNGATKKIKIDVEKFFPNVSEKILDETIRNNKILLMYTNPSNNKKYVIFASENIIQTAGLRIGLAGDRILTPSLMRDAYFTESFRDLDEEVTLIVRKVDKIAKAFAILSKKYKSVKQTILKTILQCLSDDLGRAESRGWEFSHNKTEIYIEFPTKADDFSQVYNLPDKIIPGVKLITSDVGYASVTAIETWRIDGSNGVSEHHIYRKAHKGYVDPMEIIKNIQDGIFDQYHKLPERLCDLVTIDVQDPITALKEVLAAIGIKKILGQKNFEKIEEVLESDFTERTDVTAYEIALEVMNLPSRCANLKPYILENLRAECSKAPYYRFEDINKITSMPTAVEEDVTIDGEQIVIEAY